MSLDILSAELETSGPVELDQLQFDLQCDTENINDKAREDESEPSVLSSLIPFNDNGIGETQHEEETQNKGETRHEEQTQHEGETQNKQETHFLEETQNKGETQHEGERKHEGEIHCEGETLAFNPVSDQTLFSLPDVVPDALKGAANDIQISFGEPVWDTPKLSGNSEKQLDDSKTDVEFEFEEPKISLKESVRSLNDVLIETSSVPENTRQVSFTNIEEQKKDDSESEFEDEYAEQDVVKKSESDSDSEFEVPERPNLASEAKPSTTDVEAKFKVESKEQDSIPPTDSSAPSKQPSTDSSLQNATSPNIALTVSHTDPGSKADDSQVKVTRIIPSPQPSSGEPEASVAGVVSPLQNTHHRGQGVLKTSEDWENVTTIQAEFANKDKGEGVSAAPAAVSTPLLSASEAVEHFRRSDLSTVKPNVRTSINRHGLSALTHFLFGPPKMHRDLLPERDLVFCIAGSPLDNDERVHIQMLQSIYRILTGSRFECQRFGSHWEEIGFQGRDPGTDIRGVGMLGLVQLLYFLRNPKSAQLARDVYKLSLHPTQNFPFCVMGINVSRICLQSLREDLINKECNRRQSVMDVVNEMYVGTYLHLYTIWKQGKTISDSGYVIKEVETFAKKNTKSVFRNLDQHIKRGREVGVSGEEDREEFFSVCKQDDQ